MHGVSLHYSAFFLSKLYISAVFGPKYRIIFVASVNGIFFSFYFPIFMTEHYSIVCVYHRLFIHSLLVDIWAVSTFCESCYCEHVCACACVTPCPQFFWVCTWGVELQGHMVILCLLFEELQTVFHSN